MEARENMLIACNDLRIILETYLQHAIRFAYDFIGCVEFTGMALLGDARFSHARRVGLGSHGGLPALPGMSTVRGTTPFSLLLNLALPSGNKRHLSLFGVFLPKGLLTRDRTFFRGIAQERRESAIWSRCRFAALILA